MVGKALHTSVLIDEVVAAVEPAPGKVMVDATYGWGGYSAALLKRGARVYGFDRDPYAIENGAADVARWGGLLSLHPHRFSAMREEMTRLGVPQVDAVVMDIGVSSMQLDQGERGFSFQQDGPLDMRMSQSGESAADFLNTADEAAIADVLYQYGEERQSRRVARAIVAARPLETTGDLARVVRRALGHRPHDKKDPATRSFQAVRIHVNDELGELTAGLAAAEALLREGGVLAVVSFHSLEDRIVKRFLRQASGAGRAVSRHLPGEIPAPPPTFTRLSRAIHPSEAEIERNPRARSSVLRHAVRTNAPARQTAERMTP
ncbi:MAG: 16S rRNA (cytosine(1402)-N(4))-methyltransferase RsmH [Erythrobacter sp.]|uniref:16S rRNA (cytosine(1402)-N(4))-methyltransferase RsmH n=1 Tax=Erythrobacter sp. TaxID=1042 RepID=UPI002624ED77|nr:16S rRNA (cytosine(1402)-N(4))-methyltransferase RsmH [Erythrobacter sp.]MDJ0979902.1 16S rRNA (cytosine(1402)-N(4))-methyltransferase RsmH [Erythrobacter sp.]